MYIKQTSNHSILCFCKKIISLGLSLAFDHTLWHKIRYIPEGKAVGEQASIDARLLKHTCVPTIHFCQLV